VFIIQFKIPEELAAVTLVAFGNAAPELTLDTLGALKSQSSLSIPTTLGSAIIAFGLIPPLSVLLSQERLFILSALPIAREIFFYAAGLSIFLYSISDGYIQLEEAICLACVYVIYVSSVIGYYYLYPPSNNTSSILPQDEEEEADNEIILYPSGGSEDEEGGPLLSRSQSPLSTLMRVCGWIGYPIRCLISTCMPNLRADGSPKTRVSLVRAVTVLSVSILLVGLLSNLIINICGVIINQMNVDPSTLGATLVALGAEIPDTLSAIALAKKGYTDGAMAGAIGSQVINISLGVGLPSMLVCLFGKGVVIIHDNISSIWLLTYLVFVTVIAYMLVTLPLVRLVTCTLNSQAIETLYADRSAGTVKTHITKLGAIFLLLVYISVYSFFLYENEDGDR
jgi:sodium/potassium/calcium exchanger 5